MTISNWIDKISDEELDRQIQIAKINWMIDDALKPKKNILQMSCFKLYCFSLKNN